MDSQPLHQNQRAAVAQVLVAGPECMDQTQAASPDLQGNLSAVPCPASAPSCARSHEACGVWRPLAYASSPGGTVLLYLSFFSLSHGSNLCCISTSCALSVPAKHLNGFIFRNTPRPPAVPVVPEGQALCPDMHRNAVSQKLWCIG